MIKTILFDWDGTLAQTLEVWLRTFKEAYALVDVFPTDKEISGLFGKWDAYIDLGVAPKDVETYLAHLETVYEHLEKVELYPHVRTVLEKLHGDGYVLGLVSTSTRKMLDSALKVNNIEHMFDVIISADDTDKHKPDPTPLFMALERLGFQKENALFVGDSDKDTGAATNAKMPLLLFAPKKHDLFYNLNTLQQEPSVKQSFESWDSFPYDALK